MSSDAANADRDASGTSPRVLRALAHPVRLDLLELLRSDGPLTASGCAERLGLTPKVCSYHLGTLARYGFVTETGDGKGRARPWRLASRDVGYVHDADDTGPDHAANEFAEVLLDRDANFVRRFIAERHRLDGQWRNVSTLSSNRLLLDPDQLAELTRDLNAILTRYGSSAGPSEHARAVRVALYAVPEVAPTHLVDNEAVDNEAVDDETFDRENDR